MFFSKPENRRIKPILHPNKLLHKRIQKGMIDSDANVEHACLLKYFPKYYKKIHLSMDSLNRAAKSRAEKLKIVRHSYLLSGLGRDHQITLRKLLRSSRKTLKSLPDTLYVIKGYQKFLLWTYFPNLKAMKLGQANYSCFSDRFNGFSRLGESERSIQSFWRGNRVENLEARCCSQSDLVLIKKINSSKRFFPCLKRLELHLDTRLYGTKETARELLQDQNLLRHVTHCRMKDLTNKDDWKMIQSMINQCPQLYLLSFTTDGREIPNEDFCLDLRCLQNLQVLDIQVKNFKIFAERIHFPSNLRKLTLDLIDNEKSEDFFDFQEDEDSVITLREQDARDFASFEKFNSLSAFFEKWRKLGQLLIFNLSISYSSKIDILRSFVLPLLSAVPQLETFNFFSTNGNRATPQSERKLDLGVLFSGRASLKCLKHLKISSGQFMNAIFSGLEDPNQFICLSNLSSVEINVRMDPSFGFKKFFKRLLSNNDFKSENNLVVSKSLKFLEVCAFSAEDFIKILNLMHSVSHIKNLQIDLQIYLNVWFFEDISSNCKYPINVANNTRVTVHIYMKNFEVGEWTSEHEEYFKRIFGQLQFTVNKANESECDIDSFYPKGLNRKVFMKNKCNETPKPLLFDDFSFGGWGSLFQDYNEDNL